MYIKSRACGDGFTRADAGSFSPYVAKIAAYTVTTKDAGKVFSNRGASGSVTLTLPSVATTTAILSRAREGFFIRVINPAAYAIVITATGGAKINGGSANGSITIPSGALGVTTVSCDGTDWFATTSATSSIPINFAGVTPGAETAGSLITTSTTWVPFTAVGGCGIKLLCANSALTGNFATARLRARSDVATPTWNTNTIALDLSASANIANYGELIAASCYVQDNGNNQARADHWTTGVKICTLHTGTSAGSRWGLLVTDYSTTKAATAHYLARFDKPTGSCAIDGVFAFGNCDQFTYFAKFEVAGGYLTDSDSNKDTDAGALAVYTPAGAKWIKLFT